MVKTKDKKVEHPVAISSIRLCWANGSLSRPMKAKPKDSLVDVFYVQFSKKIKRKKMI